MVAGTGVAPVIEAYEAAVILFHYPAIWSVNWDSNPVSMFPKHACESLHYKPMANAERVELSLIVLEAIVLPLDEADRRQAGNYILPAYM